jgi:hypothetical protein
MRWHSGRQSGNVEDRRGRGVTRAAGLGGGGLVIVLLFSLLTGQDPRQFLGQFEGQFDEPAPETDGRPDPMRDFVSVVLADTEDTWRKLLPAAGRAYEDPRLVLFTGQVDSACGFASAAVGPFYCPGDRKVYLDLGFFRELDQRFGAPGDFAQAYVIAHEVGHHVQTLLGISERTHAQRARLPEAEANRLSVKQELQADCFAGVWAHHAEAERDLLESGDLEEGLKAASAIGDDTLQRQARGHVVPESFTHGTAAQRVRWFRTGFDSGQMDRCDTFSAREL